MSKSRQPVQPVVRSVSIGFSSGYSWRSRQSDWGQLIWAAPGAITVSVDSSVRVVPAHQLLWLPPEHPHSVRMSGRGNLHRVYLTRRHARTMPPQPRVYRIGPLMREVLRRALQLGVLRKEVATEHRLALLILDEIAVAQEMPVELPIPRDSRALRAAEMFRSADGLLIDAQEVAKHVGASVRTLERHFAATGLSLGEWRRRARLLYAMTALADGKSVTEVGIAIGYSSTSAFVSSFRSVFGITPGKFAKLKPTGSSVA